MMYPSSNINVQMNSATTKNTINHVFTAGNPLVYNTTYVYTNTSSNVSNIYIQEQYVYNSQINNATALTIEQAAQLNGVVTPSSMSSVYNFTQGSGQQKIHVK